MFGHKSIVRILFAIPAASLLIAAVACQGAAPQAEAPPATQAAPVAAVATTAPSPTAPAFRSAATVAPPTAVPAPVPEQQGELKVDTLVIAVDPAAGETNLPWNGSVDHHQQMDLVMEVLVDIDPERNVWVPQLATSWELSPTAPAGPSNWLTGFPSTITGANSPPPTSSTVPI